MRASGLTQPRLGTEDSPDARARRRLASLPLTAYLVIGGSVLALAAAGLYGRYEPVALFVIGASTVAALAGATWVRRPSCRWPWITITIALTLFLISGVIRSEMQTMGDITANRSLVPDTLALSGYILLAVGLMGFSKQGQGGHHHRTGVALDGLIASLALATLAWAFVIQPVLQRDVPLSVRLVLIAYPSMSVFMVVVTLRIAFNPQQKLVPAFWFLLAGMTALFVGDVVYMFADINAIHLPVRVLDLPYALGYLGAGATALHVSMPALTVPGQRRALSASRVRIGVVAVALFIPALLSAIHRAWTTEDRIALSALMLAMTALAVLRIAQALLAAERSEVRLSFLANHDSLTGLPNRRLMEQHLSQRLTERPVDDTHVALLYLDLDRFKLINDTLGHRRGDDLLIQMAERLREHVRPTDLVTRIGGDEFMIVLDHVLSVSEALDLAHRLRACIAEPFTLDGRAFFVTASIGLAFASGDDRHATTEALVRDADTAMYQAKEGGRDSIALFDESMRTRVTERVELERDLRFAVALKQMHLVFQPIIRLPLGTVVGMEALIRWTHPTKGVLTPATFIPIAEENGLICEIGDWVLEETARQLAAWRRQLPEMEDLYASVNLSGAQLHDERLVQRVADVLAANGLGGSSLCLELTESVVMQDPAAAATILERLRRLGLGIAIDDFGSEYSSLAYLKRFPVSMLKIDKSFVDPLVSQDNADATLVAAIVAMAQALKITTVAEGVEHRTQADRLLALGCDNVQGYLYSRPITGDQIPELVASLGTQRLRLVTV